MSFEEILMSLERGKVGLNEFEKKMRLNGSDGNLNRLRKALAGIG
jgi:hypothetical protein